MKREIVVTGANGWIGGYLGDVLTRRGWRLTGVSRTPEAARERRPDWAWVGTTGGELEQAVERIGVVVNLAGRHVLEQPWTPDYVRVMRESRIETTRRVVAALRRATAGAPALVSASGYPVYGDKGGQFVTEEHPVSRDLVSGAMDLDWEDAARAAEPDGVRVVLLRLGLVLGHDGGAFPMLRQPFDGGAGVVLGTGSQWTPWIHIGDAARLIADAVEDNDYRGAVNVVAPCPARHADLAAAIAASLGVTECGTLPPERVEAMLGGAAELLLTSQRMTPDSATRRRFRFDHPDITAAVKEILERTRTNGSLGRPATP